MLFFKCTSSRLCTSYTKRLLEQQETVHKSKLDRKKRTTILHGILRNYTDSFKDCLMLLDSMAKAHIQRIKDFDPSIKRLMAGTGTLFEFFDFIRVELVSFRNLPGRCKDDQ